MSEAHQAGEPDQQIEAHRKNCHEHYFRKQLKVVLVADQWKEGEEGQCDKKQRPEKPVVHLRLASRRGLQVSTTGWRPSAHRRSFPQFAAPRSGQTYRQGRSI